MKGPKISIFLTSRVDGNVNHGLDRLIGSLEEKTHDISNIELLVKFDDDDSGARVAIGRLSSSPIKTDYCFGKRLRGYEDIHQGYSSLIEKASERSLLFICMADDFAVVEDWDKDLLEAYRETHRSPAIIHQRPHPPSERKSMVLTKFNPSLSGIPYEDLYIVDEAPAWSAEIIRSIGNFGPTFSTDLWTLIIEQELHKRRICITHFTRGEIVYRHLDPRVDSMASERWEGARKRNFEYAKTEEFKNIIEENVKTIQKLVRLNKASTVRAAVRYVLAELYVKTCNILALSIVEYSDAPRLTLETEDINLVRFRGRFYAIEKWKGAARLENMNKKELGQLTSSRFMNLALAKANARRLLSPGKSRSIVE